MRRRNDNRTTEDLATQSFALRKASKAHAEAGNTWLSKVMDFSAKYFTELNKKVSKSLDEMDYISYKEHMYVESLERGDGYIYNLEDEDFNSFREEWFEINSQYGDYLTWQLSYNTANLVRLIVQLLAVSTQ